MVTGASSGDHGRGGRRWHSVRRRAEEHGEGTAQRERKREERSGRTSGSPATRWRGRHGPGRTRSTGIAPGGGAAVRGVVDLGVGSRRPRPKP